MKRVDEKKRGPKYLRGEAKNRILLIALDYPFGIVESKLCDLVHKKLKIGSVNDNKVIVEHLGDIGPGRRYKGTWKNGERKLIKIPAKYEAIVGKENILGLSEKEIRKITFPEESIWLPDEDQKVFLNLAKQFLNSSADFAFAFLKTRYVQRLIETDAVIKIFEERTGIRFEEREKELIKPVISQSSSALKMFLFSNITADKASLEQFIQTLSTVAPKNILASLPPTPESSTQLEVETINDTIKGKYDTQQFNDIISKVVSDHSMNKFSFTNENLFNRIEDVIVPFLAPLRTKTTVSGTKELTIKLLYACYMVDIAMHPSFFDKGKK